MKSTELRVGNLFYVLHEESEEVSIVTWETIKALAVFELDPNDEIYSRGGPNNYYAGIPLTDEWLTKLGFWEKYKSTCNRWYLRAKHLNMGCQIIDPEDDNDKLTGKFYYSNNDGDIDIKYVHQLQNLYFALTGEELL